MINIINKFIKAELKKMSNYLKQFLIGVFGTILSILFALTIFFLTCIGYSVKQDEYAVIENTFTMKFHDDILSQGMYILHPGDRMIKFKRTLQSIELGNLNCLTRDEVMLQIHASIQFEYVKDQIIPTILKKFKNDEEYKSFLQATTESSILESCLRFTALEYYEERANVDGSMYNDLLTNINDKDIGSTIEFFQLVDISYPPTYIDILHQKQNTKQDLITAENNRATEIVNANTNFIETIRQVKINLINAQNYYDMILHLAKTEENSIINQWNNRNEMFKNIVSDLNLSPEMLIEYIKSEILRNTNNLYSSL